MWYMIESPRDQRLVLIEKDAGALQQILQPDQTNDGRFTVLVPEPNRFGPFRPLFAGTFGTARAAKRCLVDHEWKVKGPLQGGWVQTSSPNNEFDTYVEPWSPADRESDDADWELFPAGMCVRQDPGSFWHTPGNIEIAIGIDVAPSGDA